MQLGRVINLRGYNKIFSFLKENNILLIMVFFYLSGFCFGIISLKKFEGYLDFSQKCFNEFISSMTSFSLSASKYPFAVPTTFIPG